ncbi:MULTISPECIES: TetR/AcrR family transcriptional regulator [Glycomyces]|uniref:AcrR family transcriptional regulator n=2 Tax=Glycomyces TaxID=58113 RepID=A0A9X3PGV1_9ACTN|nr:TetR/AcrR family transcriptional regulator [Glycomyces lechevalierae]MDA1385075.1 TetR/AcrR family transcriptional regulator [Glycomyces lechevalierae]MDR7337473.1 AcrR family transcriptional regulator [Glycomyces lechevalierae]
MERRSRLSPEREAEIFATVERLVREHGYEKITMQQVATEAHTSTATLYRHWNGKPRLVVEAIRHRKPHPLDTVDTGSLRGDLLAGVGPMASTAPGDHELMAGIHNAARNDEELAQALREVLAAPLEQAVQAIIDRAAARGEIDSDAPGRRFIHELLLAPIAVRPMITGVHPDEAYLTAYIDAVILPSLGVRR